MNLKDLAVKTGYSINTVSRALRGKDDIAEETIERIKQIAKEMGGINILSHHPCALRGRRIYRNFCIQRQYGLGGLDLGGVEKGCCKNEAAPSVFVRSAP